MFIRYYFFPGKVSLNDSFRSENTGRELILTETKSSSAFLSDQNIGWGATSAPLHIPFFPNLFRSKF